MSGGDKAPSTLALYQNVPNPFNPGTVIAYDMPVDNARVTLRVYDVRGRLATTLVDRIEQAGHQKRKMVLMK